MNRIATLTAALGCLLLAPLAAAQAPTVTVTADISANTTWSASETYLLDGLIFVRPGATLIIEPGTVIKGKEAPSASTGDLASGLVVMVNADLIADGNADAPIIFTAEADNVNDPTDTDENDRGLWGGVILLGRSTTNSTPAINNIEGVPASNDTRFGCDNAVAGFECDEEDSSGILRYVSIRHGGFGFETDSEINGATFGAVGSGTIIEHVEVFANSDDAFEFFGGTAQGKYLIGAFGGDDVFDTDRGFRGKFQFGLAINSPGNDAGRCLENDSGVSTLGGEDTTPYAIPVYSNLTCIGAGEGADDTQLGEEGNSAALQLRDNTGGKIYNSIFADYPGSAVNIEALSSGEDTENRFGQNTENDDLTIRNNYFFQFDAGDTFAALVDDDSDNSPSRQSEIEALLGASNTIGNPMIVAYGTRDQDMSLDPRLMPSSPGATAASFSFTALDDFFTEVDYIGAFAPTDSGMPFWAAGWTALDQMGYFSGNVTVANEGSPQAPAFGLRAFPNPASGDATVAVTLERAQDVRVTLVDVLGREVAVARLWRDGCGPHAAGAPDCGRAGGHLPRPPGGRGGRGDAEDQRRPLTPGGASGDLGRQRPRPEPLGTKAEPVQPGGFGRPRLPGVRAGSLWEGSRRGLFGPLAPASRRTISPEASTRSWSSCPRTATTPSRSARGCGAPRAGSSAPSSGPRGSRQRPLATARRERPPLAWLPRGRRSEVEPCAERQLPVAEVHGVSVDAPERDAGVAGVDVREGVDVERGKRVPRVAHEQRREAGRVHLGSKGVKPRLARVAHRGLCGNDGQRTGLRRARQADFDGGRRDLGRANAVLLAPTAAEHFQAAVSYPEERQDGLRVRPAGLERPRDLLALRVVEQAVARGVLPEIHPQAGPFDRSDRDVDPVWHREGLA